MILSSGENNITIDAGYYLPASLGDLVFDDKNANGIQDSGEPGIEGAIVSLTGTDAAGNPISSSTTTNANGLYSFNNLAPGNYTVIFTKPAGYTNSSPADFGGNDTKDSDANILTGIAPPVVLLSGDNNTTIDAGYYKPASLGDFVWEDKNANGQQDPGETPIANVTVSLQNSVGGSALDINGNVISNTTTNNLGIYSFTNLKPGLDYVVVFSAPVGYVPTVANTGLDVSDSDANPLNGKTAVVNLASGENNQTIDAGYYKLGSIGDYVWEDKNANGIQDSNESGIASVTVNLTGTDGAGNPVTLSTTTGANGQYIFPNLMPGSYVVTFVKPSGYSPSPVDLGGNDEKDSDADIVTGASSPIVLASGENNLTIDAGFYKPASLGDYVWEDKNANGQQDTGEPAIQGVIISLEDAAGNPALDNNGNTVASTTTNSSGLYSFTNLKPGVAYIVKFTTPAGYVNTSLNIGNDLSDSDVIIATGKTSPVTLSSGENNITIDAGYYIPAKLGDFVWEDKNANGIQDPSELGISGAIVELTGTDASGNAINLTTTTNSNGLYQFENLAPGNYQVHFVKPSGFTTTTTPDLGGVEAKDSDANPTNGLAPALTLVSGDDIQTIDAGYYNAASLGDYVWEDKNGNGQQDSGEPVISGVIVSLQNNLGNPALDNNGNPVANTTTNGSGIYNFSNLKPGIEYVVVFTKPAGYNTTGANIGTDGSDSDASVINGKTSPVILSSGENNPTIDAGYYLPASLGDFVWEDKNANGIQDTGETGIANVIVTLVGTDGAGNPVSLTTTTNNLGAYNFTNLAPGSYTVTFNKPLNFVASPADLGGDDAKDSDANPTTGIAPTVILASGDNNSTIDAGFFKPASLGDYVWEDKNANGQQDPSEPVIANVVVSLEDASGNQATDINGNLVPNTTTNTSGIYSFTNLKPGVEYVVKFTTPSGFVSTQANFGVDISDSDADKITGKTLPVILASGENNPTIDAGYYKPASLGDFVWDDKNGNGVQDSGEPGISGAVVNLTGTDGAGNPVSFTTTTNTSGLYEFTNLAPGSYTVTFEKPAGFTSGSPVDLGGNDLKDSDANPTTGITPTVTLVSGENNTTIDAGFYKPASLGDFVWLDTNGNGVQDSGEIGIPNVTVSLTGITSLGSPVSLSTITGSNGEYSFTNLLPGNYTVTFTKPAGYITTATDKGGDDAKDSDANTITGIAPTVTLVSGENNPTIDAGYYLPASLGDFVWEDKNANGVQDSGETGIANVIVTLTGTDGAGNIISTTTTTNSLGAYNFTNLAPGSYTVTFNKPLGYVASSNDLGSNDAKDSDANPTTGVAPTVTLISGENNSTIDAGFYKPASLGDYVWEDKNGNGVQDLGEPVIANVTVNLTGTDGAGNTVNLSTTTNSSGIYSFDNLTPGDYTVSFVKPVGFVAIDPDQGGNDLKDSDANPTTGVTPTVTLASGESNTTIDAGYYKPASLGDYVWEDKNANGQQQGTEPVISGVVVSLIDASGNPALDINGAAVTSTTTNANGLYSFTNLKPGVEYVVKFETPSGFVATSSNVGLDASDSDADKTTGKSTSVILTSGENNLTIDAGYYKPASLGDFVWEDKNANGIQDSGEMGIAGAVVSLTGTDALGNTISLSTTTGTNGEYLFEDLAPGNYTVIFTKPNDFTNSSPANQGGNDAKDSDADIISGIAPAVTLVSGDFNNTIDAGFYKLASLGNYVWEDKNANGVQDSGELGIPNVTVSLSGTDALGNTVSLSTTTNSSGEYQFSNLVPGTYFVIFTKPAGYTTTFNDKGGDDAKDSDASTTNGITTPVTLLSGESNQTIDAGYYKPANIGDFVWDDKNANGVQDSGELGIPNVIVELTGTDGAGNPISTTTTTGPNGEYAFTNLVPGNYVVTFIKPSGYTSSPTDLGGNDAKDSDANLAGSTGTINLVSGQSDLTIDAGFYKPASLGDYVWEDKNGDGQQAGEPAIKNAIVSLLDNLGNPAKDNDGNIIGATTTDVNGFYQFTNLKPGVEYIVKFEAPAGSTYVLTSQNKGADISDSDASQLTGKTAAVILSSGENNPTIDAGFYLPASLGDFVWNDKNANGVQDSGEPGISGVNVTLTGIDGSGNTVTLNTTTGPNGEYSFNSLAPGTYTVTFSKPADYNPSPVNLGGDDAKDSDASITTGSAPSVTLQSGDANNTIDAGFYKLASIGDFVWNDLNANGIQDSGELGIQGVTVSLSGTDNLGNIITLSTTTGPNGEYAFTNLIPGNYTVIFTRPSGYSSTPTGQGTTSTDSDANIVTGIAPTIILTGGDNITTIDAGYYQLASIGDYAWYDLNKNGLQDDRIDPNNGNPIVLGPELPAAGIIIELHKADGTLVGTKTTGTDGKYLFTDLIPGNYYIQFDPSSYPDSRYVITTLDAGTNDAIDNDIPRVTYTSITTELISGESDKTWDIGLYRNSDPKITDPCGCVEEYVYSPPTQEDYIYSETVQVTATPGGVWRIIASNPNDPSQVTFGIMQDGNTLDFIPVLSPTNYVGSAMTETSPGIYDYSFYHKEGVGYGIVVTDGVDVQYITSSCTSVKEDYDKKLDNVCAYSAPLTLQTVFPTGTAEYYFLQNSEFVFTPNFNEYTLIQAAQLNAPITQLNPADYTPGSTIALYIKWIPTTIGKGSCPKTLVLNVKLSQSPECLASIGDRVWVDEDKSGTQNTGDTNLSGVKVTLLDQNGVPVTTDALGAPIAPITTGSTGAYAFTNLVPGSYIVQFGTAPGYNITTQNFTLDDANDSDASTIDGKTQVYTLVAGENNLTVDAGYQKQAALPVSLISFVGKEVDDKVVLNWKVNNETSFSHYEVERSNNAIEFGSIGSVKASNTSNYSYIDQNPTKDINYYRLKMVDLDGTFKYSKVISIDFYKASGSYVAVENPARNGEFIVNTDLVNPRFVVNTMLASKVQAQVTLLEPNKYLIKVPNYVAGTYFITIQSNNKMITKRVIMP